MSTTAAVSDLAALGWVIGPAIGMVGTLAATTLGAHLTRRRERLGWQREWLAERVGERTKFAADVCRAIDGIFVVYGQCADAVAGKRPLVPTSRVEAVDAALRDVLSTRVVYAHEDLQTALTAFDEARAASAEATNSRVPEAIKGALRSLERQRLLVLDEIQRDRNWVNEALAEHILPARVRVWRSLRRVPAFPVAPLPSKMPSD